MGVRTKYMSKPFEFKPEDFEDLIETDYSDFDERACRIANAFLKEWLDAAPTVYASWHEITDGTAISDKWLTDFHDNSNAELQAKLVFISKK